VNDSWSAFVDKDVAVAATNAGELSGSAFAVKDVFAIRGITAGAGNPDWLRTHEPAKRNAEVIDLLLQNGARLTGTTHTDELMYSLNGENYHYGTPVNPKAPGRIPGGSSSGSAVAVAAGLVDFALGTDTGGSVRVPSSYCGIFGFRPTHGLVSTDGVIPLAPSFDTVGWMARSPQKLLDVGRVLIRGPVPAKGDFHRIYLGSDVWEAADDDCREALAPFVSLLEKEAARVERVVVAERGLGEWMNAFRILQGLEIWAEHGGWITREQPKFGPGVAERFSWVSSLKAEDGKGPQRLREEIRARLSEKLGEEGLLVIPTVPGIAPPLGLPAEQSNVRRNRTLAMCSVAGLAGLPQVTVPIAFVEGIPVGLSFIAGPRQDLKLLDWVNRWMNHQQLLAKKDDPYVSEI